LQTLLTYGGRLTVLWLLGVTEAALALYTVFVGTNAYLQHSNIRMSTGPMKYLLATPELHRIHHSKRIDEHNSNYGDSLSIWDRLFGSYTEPDPARELHSAMGIPEIEVPQTYWAHLKLPFEWNRLHEGKAVSAVGARPGDASL
jgi:sterol desaturase/sphingolipid hydroxylase (fatty acid hydroxylase superfamily)